MGRWAEPRRRDGVAADEAGDEMDKTIEEVDMRQWGKRMDGWMDGWRGGVLVQGGYRRLMRRISRGDG